MSRKDDIIAEHETTIEGLAAALVAEEREGDRLAGALAGNRVAIGSAIADLRAIAEVPLGQVEPYIESVIETLRAVLV